MNRRSLVCQQSWLICISTFYIWLRQEGVMSTPSRSAAESPDQSRPSYDPKYEFEAPQYRDFTQETPESERGLQEAWFGESFFFFSLLVCQNA